MFRPAMQDFLRAVMCPCRVLVSLATDLFVYLSSKAYLDPTSDVSIAAFLFSTHSYKIRLPLKINS